MPETGIIIRTKNEAQWIGVVLEKLFAQTYKDFEVVIVDSGSRDATLHIARRFPVRIIEIAPDDFSYPYALNYGIAHSHATTYIAILSAHSIPISLTWLEDGLRHFRNSPKLLGVYGHLVPLPGSSFWDHVFMYSLYFFRPRRETVVYNGGMGVLGFTNALIRKDLWMQRPFNEAYGAGGEDGEWATYWLQKGYTIIKDPQFTVRHSHNLGLWGWYRQYQHWKSTSRPDSFKKLSYRGNDGPHA